MSAEKGGGKFVMAHLKDDPVCDPRMKEFKATVRCFPLEDEADPGVCIVTGERGGAGRLSRRLTETVAGDSPRNSATDEH